MSQLISGVSATNRAQVLAGTFHGSVHLGDNENSPLSRLPYAVEAPFNAYSRQYESVCLPDTRVDLLQRIYAWADGTDQPLIFWLNGFAGTGKSTVARTVARTYFENGQLGASFFFSRGGGDIGHARKFFTSIAAQLAKQSKFLRQYVCDALEKNDDIATQSLADQWRQLVLGPLSKLSGEPQPITYILVIDALDECDNDEDIQTILQLLTEAQPLETVRLRVLLTSRPDVPIRLGFSHVPEAQHQDFVLHHISPSIVDHDITNFLEHNLRLIQRKRSLPDGWPGEEVIKGLVQNASGLFIWAATACRFIWQGKSFAAKRLVMILKNSSHAVIAPEKHLNDIYLTVLKQSISSDYSNEERQELYDMLRYILGSAEVDQAVDDLHAILEVSKDQTLPLRLHHPSFRDFLLSKDRCNDANFWVDEKQAHQKLSSSCIKLLSASLKADICGVTLPGTMRTEAESSRIEQCLPPEVQYACLYWVHHLLRSGTQLQNDDDIEPFLRSHFLHWLEALGWMHNMSEGILDIISLASFIPAAKSPTLSVFVHDMKRFVLHNRAAIEQAPLQVYSSALLFAPRMSIVRKQFANLIPRWITRGPEVDENWSATLHLLKGHSKRVSAIAFSADGKQLASGSLDTTVHVWDVATGTMLQILRGHSDRVSTVAFSPGGPQPASGSRDKTVRLWDTATGATLHILSGYSENITTVAFSPDGKQLASGSFNSTVRVWDTSTGATLKMLKDHSDVVTSVAFSPDNKQLVSGSWDSTVRVRDVGTGATLWISEGHSDTVKYVVYSPHSKQLVSSSRDRTLRVWDAATGASLLIIGFHEDSVCAVAFSPDGKQIASVFLGGEVQVWNASTGAALEMLKGPSDQANTFAFSPDGRHMASAGKEVRVWDTTMKAAPPVLAEHLGQVNIITFSSDGKRVASGSYHGTLWVWDAATRETVWVVESGSRSVALVFSSDGKLLASASRDSIIRVWNVVTGTMLSIFKGHWGFIGAVAFSPDGKKLASSSTDYSVRVWDTATGSALQVLKTNTVVKMLSYSHDELIMNGSNLPQTSSQPANTPPRISVQDEWIVHGENRILRLHPDYWPTCDAVYEAVVCVGTISGRFAFFEFSLPP